MKTDFQLSECSVLYKGKPLPFGKSIAEWEKVFGKYNRVLNNGYYIWDELGVMVSADKINQNFNMNKLYIFYSNLDTPAGQKGKLKLAYDRKSLSNVLNMYQKGEGIVPLNKELENSLIIDKSIGGIEGPDKYIYPYRTYQSSVTIDGAEVKKGMSLKELNNIRESLDLQKFTFRDINMNMVNEQGTTKGENGEYWDDITDNKCKEQGYYFLNSIQYSDSELEYIKIGYYTSDEEYPFF